MDSKNIHNNQKFHVLANYFFGLQQSIESNKTIDILLFKYVSNFRF